MSFERFLRAIAIPCGIFCASCSIPPRDEANVLDGLDAVRASMVNASVLSQPIPAESADQKAIPEMPAMPAFDVLATPALAFRDLEALRTPAEESDSDSGTEWGLQIGAGLTLDPDMLLLPFTLEKKLSDGLYFGPSVQVARDDSTNFVAPTLELRWAILQGIGDGGIFDRLIPFLTIGAGAGYLEKEGRPGDNEQWRFLADAGAGLDIALGDHFALGSRVVVDWFPDDLLDEDFIFTWQVLTLRISF